MRFQQRRRTLKIDCSKFKPKKEPKSKANVARVHDNDSDSSDYSLSITLVDCCSQEYEWILDMGATYHIFVPNGGGFLVSKN